jgi:hypothetical protein
MKGRRLQSDNGHFYNPLRLAAKAPGVLHFDKGTTTMNVRSFGRVQTTIGPSRIAKMIDLSFPGDPSSE